MQVLPFFDAKTENQVRYQLFIESINNFPWKKPKNLMKADSYRVISVVFHLAVIVHCKIV